MCSLEKNVLSEHNYCFSELFVTFMTGENAENLQYDRSLSHVKVLYGVGWARFLSVDMFF